MKLTKYIVNYLNIGYHKSAIRVLGMNDKATIKIPRQLYNNINKLIEDSGYDSATDFIVYVLRDITATHSLNEDPGVSDQKFKLVKAKLKALGYI